MDESTLDELKVLLEQLNDRLSALEHTVNDTIIGGWKKADSDYKDAECYKAFNTSYGEALSGLSPYFKKLYGDDYDLNKELYDELKSTEGYGTEGFDEKALMDAKIAELNDKFKDWKLDQPAEQAEAAPEEKVEETVVVSPEDKEYDELKDIYNEYKSGRLSD